MGDTDRLLYFAIQLAERLDVGWTFLLYLTRFVGLIAFMPGIGMGLVGIAVRMPAILVFAAVATISGPKASLPTGEAMILLQIVSELLVGTLLGFIPLMVIASMQLAAQLASTTMGLNASNLIDPTFGTSSSDLARIFGDLVIIMFLLLGGHVVLINAASTIGAGVPAGAFLLSGTSLDVLVEQSARIFSVGLLVSSPVIVALLLTQFVMGLIARAVPTINIFLLSFPLTIGIGMFLCILALPDILDVMYVEMGRIDDAIAVITDLLQ